MNHEEYLQTEVNKASYNAKRIRLVTIIVAIIIAAYFRQHPSWSCFFVVATAIYVTFKVGVALYKESISKRDFLREELVRVKGNCK